MAFENKTKKITTALVVFPMKKETKAASNNTFQTNGIHCNVTASGVNEAKTTAGMATGTSGIDVKSLQFYISSGNITRGHFRIWGIR